MTSWVRFGLRVVASEHVQGLRKSLRESGRLESAQNSLEKGLENAQKRTWKGSEQNKRYGIGARIWERKGEEEAAEAGTERAPGVFGRGVQTFKGYAVAERVVDGTPPTKIKNRQKECRGKSTETLKPKPKSPRPKP